MGMALRLFRRARALPKASVQQGRCAAGHQHAGSRAQCLARQRAVLGADARFQIKHNLTGVCSKAPAASKGDPSIFTLHMKCFLALHLVHGALAKLDYNTIRVSLEWRSSSGSRVSHVGPLNPLLGFLLEFNGVVHNRRFFSPDNHASCCFAADGGKRVYRRCYENDSAVSNRSRFHRIFLSLFPSPAGRVSIFSESSRTSTFLGALIEDCDRDAEIRLLAALAAMSQGATVRCGPAGVGRSAGCLAIEEVSLGVRIREGRVLQATEVMDFFSDSNEDAEQKVFLLQSFLFHLLDTKKEIETFFDYVYGLVGGRENACFTTCETAEGGVDYALLDGIARVRWGSSHIIWFPPKDVRHPLYTRAADMFIEEKRFPFVVEAVLLSLMCHLLCNAEKTEYNAERLGSGAADARRFFAEHRHATGKITEDVGRDWLRVVEDISDPSIAYTQVASTPGRVPGYAARNVLKPGFVNLLMVVRSICGVERGPDAEWARSRRKPTCYEEIRGVFEEAFVSTLAGVCAKSLFCEFTDMEVQRSPFSDAWEVFGTVAVSIPTAGGAYVVARITCTTADADIVFTQTPFLWCEQSRGVVFEKMAEYAASPSTFVRLVGKFVHLYMLSDTRGSLLRDSVVQLLEQGQTEDILLQGMIHTDSTKIMLLDAIFSQRHRRSRCLERIERNIVSSLDLSREPVCDAILLLVSLRRPLREFAGILPRGWGRKRRARLQEIVHSGCVNLVCYCIEKSGGLCRGGRPRVDMDCVLTDLLALLIRHGRQSTIERLLHAHRRWPHEVLGAGLRAAAAAGASGEACASYFFGRISRSDLESFEYSVAAQSMSEYLWRLALASSTDKDTLEKIYCWYFCDNAGAFCAQDLYEIVEGTYMRLDMDFVYDCMVRRCPRYYSFVKFHKLFLELAVRRQIRVRSDALALIRHLALCINMNPHYMVLGCRIVGLHMRNTSDGIRQELLAAIESVERQGLVYDQAYFSEQSSFSGMPRAPQKVLQGVHLGDNRRVWDIGAAAQGCSGLWDTHSQMTHGRSPHAGDARDAPVVVVLGETGVGKTRLAVELCRMFGGEVISADSMQVYRGLDIATNKASPSEMGGVRHHMVGTVSPASCEFNVRVFRDAALEAIGECWHVRRAVPVVVGGTNYYIEALLWDQLAGLADAGLPAEVPFDTGLMTNDELHRELGRIDPEAAAALHPGDRRRVVRRIEICHATGQMYSRLVTAQRPTARFARTCILRLQYASTALQEARLRERVDDMVGRGLRAEIEAFHDRWSGEHRRVHGQDWMARGVFQAIGLKEFAAYLALAPEERVSSEAGVWAFADGVERLKRRTVRYARRQRRWIENRMRRAAVRDAVDIHHVSVGTGPWDTEVLAPAAQAVRAFLVSTGTALREQDRCPGAA
ncbi:UNVERIFIED_CONTAM: hypothetical protein PYX00_011555 [Menopon gallinae]|uniref:tRNA dimethylallyltransferase n=1 Tax=Menopon gallinae TaxID=328185 RepID=A0AAW2H802_9NEOP